MKRPSHPLLFTVVLTGLVLASCGGGGGNVTGGMMGSGLTAAFTPAQTMPGANSVSMSAGTALDDTFQVDVRVTDIVNFFGAAFRVTFDSASAEFLSFDDSAFDVWPSSSVFGSSLQFVTPIVNVFAAGSFARGSDVRNDASTCVATLDV